MAKSPLNRFNLVAPYYDSLAKLIFVKQLEMAKRHYLNYIKDGYKILYIGGGTGTILPDLIDKHQNLEITFIEASDKMLERAQKRLHHSGTCEIRWIHGTEDDIVEKDYYDIVITNFFLDTFKEEDLTPMMEKIEVSVKQSGFWIFTDFYGRTKGFKNRLLVRLMYAFFRITGAVGSNELLRYGLYFERIGFRRMAQERFYRDLIETRVYGRYDGKD